MRCTLHATTALQCGVRVVQGIEEFTSTHGAVCTLHFVMLRISRCSRYSSLRNAAYFPVQPVLRESSQVQSPSTCCNLRMAVCCVLQHSTVDQGYRFHAVISPMTVALHNSLRCRVQHCSRGAYSTRACCILLAQRVSNRTTVNNSGPRLQVSGFMLSCQQYMAEAVPTVCTTAGFNTAADARTVQEHAVFCDHRDSQIAQ